MRRPSFPFLAIATMLALLLPLEQAHCLWMNAGARGPASGAAIVKMAADHACCRGQSAQRPRESAPACLCLQLPQAAVGQPVVLEHEGGALPLAAPVTTAIGPAEPAPASALMLALDVGNPPLPVDPGAHGLRAPPLGA